MGFRVWRFVFKGLGFCAFKGLGSRVSGLGFCVKAFRV